MNGMKTMMLLAALTALFMAIGYTLGRESGMVLAFVVAAGMNLFTYWNADKIVLKMHNAQEVDAASGGDYYAIVRQLAANGRMPMPKVYIVSDDNPNAFATGRNPDHAAVAATTGLLSMLNRDEIEAVMAHELSHVKNRDTLIMTMVATIAGAISMLANFGMMFRGGDGDNRGAGIAGLLAVLIAPFAAMIVQMAISRTREYGADAGAAGLTQNPLALASALRKIAGPASRQPTRGEMAGGGAIAQLYIVPTGVSELFSTHPATDSRIAALEAMAADMSARDPTSTIDAAERRTGGRRLRQMDKTLEVPQTPFGTDRRTGSRSRSALDPFSRD